MDQTDYHRINMAIIFLAFLNTTCVDEHAGVINVLALLHRVQRLLRHGVAHLQQLPPRYDLVLLQ